MIFFTTEHTKEARRSQRDFGGVSAFRFLMAEMLKQVQHDGRVVIMGFTDSVINDRHPELVSGSLLFLGLSIVGIVGHNKVICLEDCALFLLFD